MRVLTGENVLIGLTSVDFDGPDMLLRTERGLAWNVSFKDTITAEGQALPAGGTPDRAKPLAVVIARLHTAAAQLPPIDATPVVIPTPIEGVSTATPSIDATVADEARPPQ